MIKDRFKEARELFNQGKLKEVHKLLEIHIANNPNDACAYLNLSLVLTSLGKVEESFNANKKALEIDPECRVEYEQNSLIPNNDEYVLSNEESIALRAALGLPPFSGGDGA